MSDLSTYRAYQVTGQRHFELVDRELVAPSAGHVRFRVHAAECATATHSALRASVPNPASRWCRAMRLSA